MRLIVCILLYLPRVFHATKISPILPKFSNDFMAPNPLPVLSSAPRQEKIDILKFSAKNDLVVNWNTQKPFSEEFLLVLLSPNELIPDEDVRINQQIYFLTSSLEVFERYLINEDIILQKLGNYSNSIFVPQQNVEQNFFKRRKNFHGSNLIVLTEPYYGIDFDMQEVAKNADYFPSNDTYDVTKYVKGPGYEILKNLETSLNFTTTSYRRRSGGWGTPIIFPNGSVDLEEGMVKDLIFGKADMTVSHLDIIYSRSIVIDFLPPIWNHKGGIYIRKKSLKQGFDFTVFFRPLDKFTWVLVLVSSVFVSIVIVFSWIILHPNISNIPNPFKVFLVTLKAFFGSAHFDSSLTNGMETQKVILFTTLLMGNVIWLTFNGALLSELIVPTVNKPFNSLETLLQTNYRYLRIIVFLSVCLKIFCSLSAFCNIFPKIEKMACQAFCWHSVGVLLAFCSHSVSFIFTFCSV